jgi:hypothetical protein
LKALKYANAAELCPAAFTPVPWPSLSVAEETFFLIKSGLSVPAWKRLTLHTRTGLSREGQAQGDSPGSDLL